MILRLSVMWCCLFKSFRKTVETGDKLDAEYVVVIDETILYVCPLAAHLGQLIARLGLVMAICCGTYGLI